MKKQIQESLKLVDSGDTSYGEIAKQFNVGKASVYRFHVEMLQKQVAAAKDALVQLEGKSKRARADLETLTLKYQEESTRLDKNFENHKAILGGQLDKIKEEIARIKGQVESRGISWNKFFEIVKEIKNLQAEKKRLTTENMNLSLEIPRLQKAAKQERLTISNIKKSTKRHARELNLLTSQINRDVEVLRGYDAKLLFSEQEIQGLEDRREKIETALNGFERELREKRNLTQKLTEEIAGLEKAKKQTIKIIEKKMKQLSQAKKKLSLSLDETRKQQDMILTEANKQADEIKQRALQVVHSLERNVEKLQAEEQLLVAGRKCYSRDTSEESL